MSSSVTTTITELPESRVRVEAEVAASEVARSVQKAARKLGSNLRVPGFRKGKVPAQVVITRLGRAYVVDEAVRDSLGGWYTDAIQTAEVAVVGEPEINVGDTPADGQPLAFSIEVGVRPSATLGEYRGLEVGRREATIDDAAVETELSGLRERLATLDTVERAAAEGDFAVVDYVGKVGDVPFAGGEARDQVIELGAGRLIPGFEEQLVGASAGEDRTIEVTFPEDYGSAELAGKEATFDVHVSEIKAKNLPELDDEFATDAAGFDTLAELREDIEKRLREQAEHEIGHEFERDVLDAVAEKAEIELPDSLVTARARELVSDTINNLSAQGIDRDTYLRIVGKTEEELASEGAEEAARTLRREAVLAAVIEAEKIEPTDDDVLESLAGTAERSQTTPAALLDQLRSNDQLERAREDVAAELALKLLVDSAKPVAKADEPEPAAEPAAEEAGEPAAE